MIVKALFCPRADNDFLLYPVLAVSYAESRDGRAWAIGIKVGYWGVYLGIYKLIKEG